MTSRIELARHRALDHWFADGAVEFALGLLLLGTAGIVVAQAWFPGPYTALLFVAWVGGGTWTARRWIAARKAAHAGSEGYVSFGRRARHPITALAIAAAAVVAVSLAGSGALASTALAGAVLVGALLVMLIQTRRRRLGLVLIVGLLAWIQALLAGDRYPLNIAMMLAATGLALLIMALRARLSRIERPFGGRARA